MCRNVTLPGSDSYIAIIIIFFLLYALGNPASYSSGLRPLFQFVIPIFFFFFLGFRDTSEPNAIQRKGLRAVIEL
jgi:hypothetical protein